LLGEGFRSDGTGIFFGGIIDEVRISDSARNAGWIETGYNNQNATTTFYTLSNEETPTITPTVTTNFANPGFNTAMLHGTKTGGNDATEYGFATSTSSTLSSDVATTTNGALSGNNSFSNTVGALLPNTTYYFRAYATNAAGTGYGSIKSFVTGNAGVTRTLLLFEGFKIKFIDGRIILHQRE
jgi:hypothetical protein